MIATTAPASRFGWQGQTVEYVVNAKGATELVASEKSADGLRVRVLDTQRVGDGVRARVVVDVAGPVFF